MPVRSGPAAIVQLVEMTTQPGERAVFLEELKDILVATRAWEGSEGVEVYLDEQDADRIVLILRWAGREQHAAYAEWRRESGTSVGLSPLLTGEATVHRARSRLTPAAPTVADGRLVV